MKKTNLSLAVAILALLCVPLRPGYGQDLRLAVRVFMIPPTQQFASAVPDGRGGTADLQIFGSVTAGFPRATVSFPTELAAGASEGAIAPAIRDRVIFGSGGLAARSISVRELKSLELPLSKDHPDAEGRFEESRGEGRSSDYRVKAVLLSSGQGKSLIRLRFDAGWHASGGRLGVSLSDTVISAPLELSEPKLFLIGAPSEGSVYWLAVCALPGP